MFDRFRENFIFLCHVYNMLPYILRVGDVLRRAEHERDLELIHKVQRDHAGECRFPVLPGHEYLHVLKAKAPAVHRIVQHFQRMYHQPLLPWMQINVQHILRKLNDLVPQCRVWCQLS